VAFLTFLAPPPGFLLFGVSGAPIVHLMGIEASGEYGPGDPPKGAPRNHSVVPARSICAISPAQPHESVTPAPPWP
jgi:hypothetical protein